MSCSDDGIVIHGLWGGTRHECDYFWLGRGAELPKPRMAVPLEMTATMLPRVVFEGAGRIPGDRFDLNGDARRIGERQIALGRHRLGRIDLQFAGPHPLRAEIQRLLRGHG